MFMFSFIFVTMLLALSGDESIPVFVVDCYICIDVTDPIVSNVRNLDPGLGQAQQCGGINPVNIVSQCP